MAVVSVVTQASDPVLWQSLYDEYLAWNCPGYVSQVSKSLYKVVHDNNGNIEFHQYETMDYLDSRSTGKSRPATYRKLKEGNP